MMNRSTREALMVAANQNIKERDYWITTLSGDMVKTGFPYDFKKNKDKAPFHQVEFKLIHQLYSTLMKLSNQSDQALNMILIAGLVLLLNKYTGNRDIIVGTPIYKQDIEEEFINTVLALRNRIRDDMTFKELLLQVKHTVTEAEENQNYPIEVLITQLNIPALSDEFPLFDIAILLENIHDKDYLRDIHFKMIFSFLRTDECIAGKLKYNPLLYGSASIKQIIAHFKHLLRETLSRPNVKVSALDLLTDEMKKQLLIDFNDTAVPYPQNSTLHRLFKEQAKKTPDRVALVGKEEGGKGRRVEGKKEEDPLGQVLNAFGEDSLRAKSKELRTVTYKELNEQSDQLAKVLIEKGVQLETIVAIILERSVEMIVGLLGILKVGGAYMPIDPDYPEERIDYMLKDSGANMLVTTNSLTKEGEKLRKYEGKKNLQIVPLESSTLQPFNPSTLPSPHLHLSPAPATSLAYIIYTSGSTGNPKGVMVVHRNVVRLVKNTNYVELNQETRILQTGAPVFDATTFEIWGSLLNGGRLVLVENDVILNAHRLGAALTKNRINTLWLSSPLFNQLMEQNSDIFPDLTYLLVGGDVLSPRYINRVRRKNKKLKVINGYGPTENTTFSTYYLIDKDFQDQVPIGWPISNSSAYVLDNNGCLQPPRVWGELWVGGEGVARGYMNSPELTSEKFINDKLQITNKAHPSVLFANTLYRTGDVVRWSAQGTIEFAGRKDNQVKIRGYRVETGEIETLLLKHNQIKEAVVMVKEEEVGRAVSTGIADKYLCAYVVTESEVLTSELREYLSGKLPSYMIPSYFVLLEKMPLTANGKVNRKALPQPGLLGRRGDYTAPRNPVEEELGHIWSEVLGVKKHMIGIDDDFFHLGGHSLNATLLTAKIHKILNVNVPLARIFETPTIRELAGYINGERKEQFVPVEPVEKKEYYPLSSAQKRLYILHQLKPDDTGYNIWQVGILEGLVDKEKFVVVFRRLINRHESLRTSFHLKDNEPVQRVKDKVEFNIEYYDMKEVEVKEIEGTRGLAPLPTESAAALISSFIRSFDLSRAPLLRVGLIKLHHSPSALRGRPSQKGKEHRYILMVDMHHIITDGTSIGILMEEFMSLYSGKELPKLRLQYRDYSQWQARLYEKQEITYKNQEKYWLKQFKEGIPQLNFPTDHPTPEEWTFKGDFIDFEINKEITAKIRKMLLETGTTLYIFLLAVYTILLGKYTSKQDIVVGTGSAGRTHADLEHVIGMFVNMLAIKNRPREGQTFNEFLAEVKKNALAAFENQDYQFEELIKQLNLTGQSGRNPLFDVEFTFQNFFLREIRIPRLTINPYRQSHLPHNARFDLSLHASEDNGVITLILTYAAQLFKRSTIEDIKKNFMEILEQVTADPKIKLEDMKISYHLSAASANPGTNQIQFDF